MSKIEWTDKTISVIVVKGEDGQPNGWYCERVSPGCEHCYAERLNGTSFYGGNGLPYRQSRAGRPELMLRRDVMAKWARTRKPHRLFLNSMTDTFGEFVPKDWIYEIFDAMTAAPLVTFQVLTKRAKRMYNVVTEWLFDRRLSDMPANIWLGFSAENQEWFDKRAPWVIDLPAVTFVSAEPLIGPIDMMEALGGEDGTGHMGYGIWPAIDWVIVGGESGPGARPMHPQWARDIRDQCQRASVDFFFKQWGEWLPMSHWQDHLPYNLRKCYLPGEKFKKAGKHRAGRILDGRTWDEFPAGQVAV